MIDCKRETIHSILPRLYEGIIDYTDDSYNAIRVFSLSYDMYRSGNLNAFEVSRRFQNPGNYNENMDSVPNEILRAWKSLKTTEMFAVNYKS